MKPWMNRTESSAIAATRQCRSPSVAAAARGGTVSVATTVISTSFAQPGPPDLRTLSAGSCVVEAAPLQFGQGAGHPRCQHHTGNQVIGQLGSQRIVRQFVRVHLGGDQLLRKLPYRVVTGEEDDAASLQRRDGVVVRRERAFGVLVVFRVGGGTLLLRDQRVALELAASQRRKLVFLPHRRLEQRQMCGAVRRRDDEKIGMPERPDLRV